MPHRRSASAFAVSLWSSVFPSPFHADDALPEDLPWIDSMASSLYSHDHGAQLDNQLPTVAAFSPSTIAGSSLTSRQRSSIIVHRKSPLLVATPPAVTRALAYSHPFVLPLNKLAGLVTWTSGDPWESFLLVAGFWAVVMFSDVVILWAGPILVVIALILGMYWRRYSPLSSRAWSGQKRSSAYQKATAEGWATRHHTSLDEIVENLRTFTTRCNILLEPLLDLTDFLSTQRTATSATTKPALTALFFRILLVTPIWILLTFPPFYLLTTRRVVMLVGTFVLTYHCRPARVARVILWRSLFVRRICSILTGLHFSSEIDKTQTIKAQGRSRVLDTATKRAASSGVRFTFAIFENQRRWLGIGWTYSLFPSERTAWTDEHLNSVPPRDGFELPDVHTGHAEWRWIENSEWHIEGADESTEKADPKSSDGGGWIYYDNKVSCKPNLVIIHTNQVKQQWNDGRRGQDGWDRYTRRRKWYRDAELVEIPSPSEDPADSTSTLTQALQNEKNSSDDSKSRSPSSSSMARHRRWFGSSKSVSDKASNNTPAGATTSTSNTNPTSSSSSSVKVTSSTNDSPSGKTASGPISIQSRSKPSSYYSGHASVSGNSVARDASLHGSDTLSVRDREIADAQDRLDRWGTRATGGTERVEREMGLSDEMNMGLS